MNWSIVQVNGPIKTYLALDDLEIIFYSVPWNVYINYLDWFSNQKSKGIKEWMKKLNSL